MPLTLRIENHAVLPDGGPIEITVAGRRGIDIGRDQYLDWVLPDPDRVVSGKHAEIRFREGGYWLTDVSRNGTFLNRNQQRLQEPHRLADGDRVEIGHYVIAVRLAGETETGEATPVMAARQATPEAYWAPTGDVAPAISARDLRPPSQARPVRPDVIDWAIDVPEPGPARAPEEFAPPPGPQASGMDWAVASVPAAPLPPPPVPTPRRRLAPADASPWEVDPEPDLSAGWELPPLPSAPDAPPAAASPASGPPDSQPPAAEPPRHRPDDPSPIPPFAEPPAAPAILPRTARPEESREGDVMQRFARGLGVPVETIAWRDAGDLAEELGQIVRLASDNVKQLLTARAEAKRVARTTNQTMIQALDNNPLKFAPTIDDALRIMLGRPSGGYLDSRRALETSFRDLKSHQVKTFSAMQHAVRLLLDDLAPEAIAEADEGDRGLGGLLGSRKARLWEIYAARWDAVASAQEDGMAGAFTLLFAECYEGSR